MAKISKKYSFSKGIIEFENNKYLLTEVGKDESTEYDLSAILDSFAGLEGISLTISVDNDVPEMVDNGE